MRVKSLCATPATFNQGPFIFRINCRFFHRRRVRAFFTVRMPKAMVIIKINDHARHLLRSSANFCGPPTSFIIAVSHLSLGDSGTAKPQSGQRFSSSQIATPQQFVNNVLLVALEKCTLLIFTVIRNFQQIA